MIEKAFIFSLLAASIALASPEVKVNKSTESTKAKSTEKSKQKSITREKSKEKGFGKTIRAEKGIREAERKEISKALERLKSEGITIEVSLPTLVFMELSKKYPSVFQKTINDFYTVSLSENGIINLTRIEYLNSVAKAQTTTDYINTKAVIDYIKTLMSISSQILSHAKIINGETLGIDDFNEIAKDIAEKVNIKKKKDIFPISNRCILVSDYQHFRCGTCTLDVSNSSGIPVLSCSGIKVFSPDSLLGYSIRATANTIYSMKDVENEVKSTETYRAISNAVEKYVRRMERKGISVNKTLLKKLLLERVVKDTKGLDLILTKMKEEEQPETLFRLLR